MSKRIQERMDRRIDAVPFRPFPHSRNTRTTVVETAVISAAGIDTTLAQTTALFRRIGLAFVLVVVAGGCGSSRNVRPAGSSMGTWTGVREVARGESSAGPSATDEATASRDRDDNRGRDGRVGPRSDDGDTATGGRAGGWSPALRGRPNEAATVALPSDSGTLARVDAENERRQSAVMASVNRWLGTPYRYGGSGQSGIDCSAFVQAVYDEALDLRLPRTTDDQRLAGTRVPAEEIGFGDLVFFQITRRQGHVGVVIGPNEFAHASSSSGVTVSRLDDPYWVTRFDGAVRYDPHIAQVSGARVLPVPRRSQPARSVHPERAPNEAQPGSDERRRGW